VLRRDDAVSLVEIEDEGVLVAGASGRLQILNAVGVRAWNLLDGSSSVREICGDLVARFGAGYDDVLEGTRTMLGELVAAGMVVPAGDRTVTAAGPAGRGAPSEPVAGSPGREAVIPDARSGRFRVAGRVVEVRTNHGRVLELLEDGFATGDGDDAPLAATFSLFVGAASGKLLAIHSVGRDGVRVFRSPDLGRAIRALLGEIAALSDPPERAARIRGRALVSASGAVVLVAPHPALLCVPERRLARLGWHACDAPPVVDGASRELLVPELDDPVAALVDERFPRERAVLPVAPGRYPIRALVALGYAPDRIAHESAARRLVMLCQFVARGDVVGTRELTVLSLLVQGVRVAWASGLGLDDITGILARLAPGPDARA
jgi:hypothetical protein